MNYQDSSIRFFLYCRLESDSTLSDQIDFIVDSRHSVAVGQMGNYQDYLKQTNPLRELDPGMNRAHMFGNPFKLAKDQVSNLINLTIKCDAEFTKQYVILWLRLIYQCVRGDTCVIHD